MSTCVIVAECPSCTECFPPDDIGGPVWTCSRCGGSEIFDEGDRGRCSSCNVFMAKEAPASCPLCEEGIDPDDLDEIEKWETSGRDRVVSPVWAGDRPLLSLQSGVDRSGISGGWDRPGLRQQVALPAGGDSGSGSGPLLRVPTPKYRPDD